jgi:hypothetical protein
MATFSRSVRNPVATVHERRVTVRYTVQRSIFCQPGTGRSDQFWRFATMLDLSADGVRVVLRRGFTPGQVLLIELSNDDGSFCLSQPAHVVHATEEANGWIIGCAFEHSLSEDELHRLL